MTKCNLCQDRLSEGSAPACVAACPTGALGFSPPVAEEGEPSEWEGKGEIFGPAVDVPGFGDPAEADPGFWVADPTGAIRSRWFRELKALLGTGREEPLDQV
jgi:hypothetical protein